MYDIFIKTEVGMLEYLTSALISIYTKAYKSGELRTSPSRKQKSKHLGEDINTLKLL